MQAPPIVHCVRETAGIVSAAVSGFLVWALSPSLAGTPLPWDASWPFYSIVFLVTGLIVAQFARIMWLAVIGAWAGQLVALIMLPLDRTVNMWGEEAWWTLGVVGTGVGSLIVVAGWILGNTIRKRLWRTSV